MDKTKEILRQRAVLAAKKAEEERSLEGMELIRFRVKKEVYALEASLVSEVHAYITPTSVPYMPPYIEGIVNIRGRFVSVVDLGRFLELEQGEEEGARFLMFLADESIEFGVAVDEILEEIRLPRGIIRPIPQGFVPARKELIAGVTEDGTVILDGGKLMADPAMTVYQEIATTFKGRKNVT